MASIGTLYCWPHDPRKSKVLVTASYANKSLKVVEDSHLDQGSEFSKIFPKGQKVPAFVDNEHKVQVMESTGIAYHIAKMYDSSNKLLGVTKVEESRVAQWLFYSDTNIWSSAFAIATMYYGYYPLNKDKETKALEELKKCLTYLDKYLLNHTFLAAENVTLADIVVCTSLAWAYSQYLEEKDRKEYMNVLRWFNTCLHQPEFKKHFPEFKLCEKRMSVTTPPKPAAKSDAKPAKNEAKKEAAKPAEEAKPAAEKKVKHPCESLPPTSLNLDEWKRVYSNNDTRPTAIEWFWKNWDPTGYSVYHVQYKYNNELTMTFMSSNLVGGFFQRIERARKYAFGTILVLGENNDNIIEGYFVFRGQDVLPEVIDAPDYPSFSFTKVPSDKLTKAPLKTKFEDFLAWDGNLDGKKFADGKIFK